jgi:hypothetical protein
LNPATAAEPAVGRHGARHVGGPGWRGLADERNEPRYNARMVRADKVTPGPIGKGTRFRSAVASFGREAEMVIE